MHIDVNYIARFWGWDENAPSRSWWEPSILQFDPRAIYIGWHSIKQESLFVKPEVLKKIMSDIEISKKNIATAFQGTWKSFLNRSNTKVVDWLDFLLLIVPTMRRCAPCNQQPASVRMSQEGKLSPTFGGRARETLHRHWYEGRKQY